LFFFSSGSAERNAKKMREKERERSKMRVRGKEMKSTWQVPLEPHIDMWPTY